MTARPVRVRRCWCRDCLYFGAGSFTLNVMLPRDGVTFSGDLAFCKSTADSGNRLARGFCPTCGTPATTAPANPSVPFVIVRAGALDDPNLVTPIMDIRTDRAPSWAVLDPALPKTPHQPASASSFLSAARNWPNLPSVHE